MPTVVSYPGVYVEELPSGQHTVTGVATSITAFVGRARSGPTDGPRTITSYADFERLYGGLAYGYPMSYTVRDFFLNGGSEAVIVRLFEPLASTGDVSDLVLRVVQAAVTTEADATKSSQDVADAAKAALGTLPPNPDDATKKKYDAANSVYTAMSDALTRQPTIDPQALTTIAIQAAGPYVPSATLTTARIDFFPAAVAGRQQTLQTAAQKVLADVQKATSLSDATGAATKSLQGLTTPAYPPTSADGVGALATYYGTLAVANAVQRAAKAPAATVDQVKAAAQASVNYGTAKLNFLVGPSVVAPYSLLSLVAANEGSWANGLTVTVDQAGITDQVAARFQRYGLTKADLFNLQAQYPSPTGRTTIERFPNVSVTGANAPNRIDRVLQSQSTLIRVASNSDGTPILPSSPPTSVASASVSPAVDSAPLTPTTYTGDEDAKTGIYQLKKVDLFNLLCIPPDGGGTTDTDLSVYGEAAKLCADRRAILIVDPPTAWSDKARTGQIPDIQPTDLEINGDLGRNAAVYFPRVMKADLEMNNQEAVFPACGIIAGVIAATDTQRGVWKAPAGVDAGLNGITRLELGLTDQENGLLNPLGINCLRTFPVIGPVIWGARTLRGADQLSDDYKYLSVRRLTLYIEESLYRNTQWAVFEPNDEALWGSLRVSIGTFMADLMRQGAFYSYTVVCDKTTTTQYDIDRGIVNVLVAFAPVKPAEFVVLMIQQQAGQSPS